VALGDPGWQVTDLSTSPGLVDLTYARRAEELEIAIYPASLYAGYYADRSELADRQSIQVLGQDATMWTYSAHDHTAIRTAQDGHFVEVRGTGMDVDAFRALLADLVQTDQAGLAGSMPGSVTTPGDRDRVGRRLLQGVDLPPGFTDANVTLTAFNDAYQTAAQVAGQVGCAWLDAFDSGSAADRQAAVAALDGSRRWPLLVDIADQGGYAQVFWGTADRLDALSRDPGASAAGLRQGIC
jgi:hypothetical protein